MFINFTNHPSANWDQKQRKEAQTYGEIQDVPFPIVPPSASQAEVHQIARDYAEKILSYHPDAVLCQGEFTLAFQVITLLKKEKIKVLAATSERRAVETCENGATKRSLIFAFEQFREY